jgi:hypothetical protein
LDAVLSHFTLFFYGITFAGKGFLQSLFHIIDLHEGRAAFVHRILGKMYAGFGVVSVSNFLEKTAQFQGGPAAIAVCKLYFEFIHKNITLAWLGFSSRLRFGQRKGWSARFPPGFGSGRFARAVLRCH